MQQTKIPSTIKPAGYGRSLLGYFIDFACTLVLAVVLYYALGRTALRSASHYDDAYDESLALVERSKLADVADDKIVDLSYDARGSEEKGYAFGYEEYAKRVFHYYFVEVGHGEVDADHIESSYPFAFLSSDAFDDVYTDHASIYYKQAVGKRVYANVFKISGDGKGNGDKFFALPENDAGYRLVPTVNEEYKAKLSNPDEAIVDKAAKELLDYFIREDSSDTIMGRAVSHFNAQACITAVQNKLNVAQYVQLLPSLIIPPLAFYFLVPLFSKNGRTLGKRIADTAVIGSDGYTAKKIHIVLHYLIILLEWETLLLPNFALGLMVFTFLSLIEFMVLAMSKNHQSIHDKLARTLVIRYKESTWFPSKEAEDEYIEANPSSLIAKIRRQENGTADPNQRQMVVTEEQLLAEESILDLSTINRRREEARNMTSFDEYERTHGGTSVPEQEEEEEVELTEQERADLLALEGELPEEESPQGPRTEREHIEEEDDFVDGK